MSRQNVAIGKAKALFNQDSTVEGRTIIIVAFNFFSNNIIREYLTVLPIIVLPKKHTVSMQLTLS